MIKTDTLIIGAGPVGLFCVHQLGIIGLKCEVVDNLDKIGGQCIELYPDKPIYDIPAVPECTGEELTKNLIEQIKAFKTNFHLNERVEELKKVEKKWLIKTNKGTEFEASTNFFGEGLSNVFILELEVIFCCNYAYFQRFCTSFKSYKEFAFLS